MKKEKLTNKQSLIIAKKTAKQRARHRRYLKQKYILKAQIAQMEMPHWTIKEPPKKKSGLLEKLKNLWHNIIKHISIKKNM